MSNFSCNCIEYFPTIHQIVNLRHKPSHHHCNSGIALLATLCKFNIELITTLHIFHLRSTWINRFHSVRTEKVLVLMFHAGMLNWRLLRFMQSIIIIYSCFSLYRDKFSNPLYFANTKILQLTFFSLKYNFFPGNLFQILIFRKPIYILFFSLPKLKFCQPCSALKQSTNR